MDWTVILIIIAAVALAINQAVKDVDAVRQKWPNLKLPSLFAYVPIFLLVIAGIIWLFGSYSTNDSASVALNPTKPPAKSDDAQVRFYNAIRELDLRDKSYISGIPFEQLKRISSDLTEIQSSAAIEPYLKSDIELAGLIQVIRPSTRGGVAIHLQGKAFSSTIVMFVDGNTKDYINWSKGDLIYGHCKLDLLEDDIIFLKGCELNRKSAVKLPSKDPADKAIPPAAAP